MIFCKIYISCTIYQGFRMESRVFDWYFMVGQWRDLLHNVHNKDKCFCCSLCTRMYGMSTSYHTCTCIWLQLIIHSLCPMLRKIATKNLLVVFLLTLTIATLASPLLIVMLLPLHFDFSFHRNHILCRSHLVCGHIVLVAMAPTNQ